VLVVGLGGGDAAGSNLDIRAGLAAGLDFLLLLFFYYCCLVYDFHLLRRHVSAVLGI
jgi:hypothetical protein